MPDTSIKTYYGDFPDREVIDAMKVGDKFLWIPDSRMRKFGAKPTLYTLQTIPIGSRTTTIIYPHWPLISHTYIANG